MSVVLFDMEWLHNETTIVYPDNTYSNVFAFRVNFSLEILKGEVS